MDSETSTDEWFLSELIRRLPVKDVFRFKCVSKQWFSFISDPLFPDRYISSRRGSQDMMFFPSWFRLADEDHLTNRTLSFPRLGRGRGSNSDSGFFCTMAAEKGFLLLGWLMQSRHGEYRGEFYIWSALTHQWFRLPSPPRYTYFRKGNVGFIPQVESGILTSYKVAIIDSHFSLSIDMRLFSSETGRWSHIIGLEHEDPLPEIFPWWRPVHLNNTLYWADAVRNKVLAYDPYANPNKFRTIKLPTNGNNICPCAFSQGCLKFVATSVEEECWEIWQLGDDSRWCLENKTMFKDVQVSTVPSTIPRRFRRNQLSAGFVSFHPLNPDVIYLYVRKWIWSCNLQTKKMEPLGLSSPRLFSNMDSFLVDLTPGPKPNPIMHTLVELPPWPISISSTLTNRKLAELPLWPISISSTLTNRKL